MTGSPGHNSAAEVESDVAVPDAVFERTSTNPTRGHQVTPLPGMVLAVDGQMVVKEFELGGVVPRAEQGGERKATAGDVYVRLENTIYGPLNGDEMAAMLASGQFTGYESASSDLQHWTPLLYHPRMNLTGYADPDHTHALLHERSTLPQASRKGSRIRLEDFADGLPDEIIPSVPLAAIMLRPRKQVRRTTRGVELPVFAELKDEPVADDPDMIAVPAPLVSPAVRAERESGNFAHPPGDVATTPLQGGTPEPTAAPASPTPARAARSGTDADPGFSRLQVLLGTLVLTSVLIAVYLMWLR